jgi:hypothetical protein
MPVRWAVLRDTAKWYRLPCTCLLLLLEIVYHRAYVRLEQSPLRIAMDAPGWFGFLWMALLVTSILLTLITLPKWQSLVGLVLICIVIALRADVP